MYQAKTSIKFMTKSKGNSFNSVIGVFISLIITYAKTS